MGDKPEKLNCKNQLVRVLSSSWRPGGGMLVSLEGTAAPVLGHALALVLGFTCTQLVSLIGT
jgi:hypothetical protein